MGASRGLLVTQGIKTPFDGRGHYSEAIKISSLRFPNQDMTPLIHSGGIDY